MSFNSKFDQHYFFLWIISWLTSQNLLVNFATRKPTDCMYCTHNEERIQSAPQSIWVQPATLYFIITYRLWQDWLLPHISLLCVQTFARTCNSEYLFWWLSPYLVSYSLLIQSAPRHNYSLKSERKPTNKLWYSSGARPLTPPSSTRHKHTPAPQVTTK